MADDGKSLDRDISLLGHINALDETIEILAKKIDILSKVVHDQGDKIYLLQEKDTIAELIKKGGQGECF